MYQGAKVNKDAQKSLQGEKHLYGFTCLLIKNSYLT